MNRIIILLVSIILTLAAALPSLAFSPEPEPLSPPPPQVVTAKACIVLDDKGAVLYEKNSSIKHPPASTVKLVTAMVALDRLDPAKLVSVSRSAAQTRSIKPRLRLNDELTVSDLLHLALMKSINSAAVALAEETAGSEAAFVELMNQKAEELGACDTHFVTASGLPKGQQYTTARDLAVILKKALTYPLIKEILAKKEAFIFTTDGKELYLENTDNLLWSRSNMVGGKTGFTNSARHCFVGALDTGKGLIYTVVLGSSSRSRMWESTETLADIGTNPDLVVAFQEPPAKKYRRHARKLKKI